MSYIVVDVEADNKSPYSGSMVCFGAVLVSDYTKTFYGKTKPITNNYNIESLSISGFSREEHEKFDDPKKVMLEFKEWINKVSNGKPIFISDNPAFDWQWINYYFDMYNIKNPFGYSARRIGDIYCGLVKDASKNWEWKNKFRRTIHDHNPVNDCIGNVESLHYIKDMGLNVKY
jgi:hypothetical protein